MYSITLAVLYLFLLLLPLPRTAAWIAWRTGFPYAGRGLGGGAGRGWHCMLGLNERQGTRAGWRQTPHCKIAGNQNHDS